MGNACCAKKKKKVNKIEQPNIKESPSSSNMQSNHNNPDKQIEIRNQHETDNTELAHSKITKNKPNNTKSKQSGISQNDPKINKSEEKETNVSKNDYSFAKITKIPGNQFSFEVYGEDISSLDPKFLLQGLGNVSNTFKINISRNELLLMTDENKEILRFLNANNITKKDLISDLQSDTINGTLALDNKLRIAANSKAGKRVIYIHFNINLKLSIQ